jgi:Na+-translocating ferredoxin:NAD+ oxidoreductase RnfC subunit
MALGIAEQVREAGVVGAGGAGFPTYVKMASRVDTYIVNGAECEPLLYKDKELMRQEARDLLTGLRLAMDASGATRGIVAVKGKYTDAIDAMRAEAPSSIHFHLFENFYPAGDEFVVVFDATGRLIPPGGIPLQVGCAVSNVETLVNVARAAAGRPVTQKALTVAGAVREPLSFWAPVGITARECIEAAGGATCENPVLLEGGAMMGRVVFDLDTPVTKTTGGYIVLPSEHRLIRRKTLSPEKKRAIARSGCDQCCFCTELCPRFLLGYAIEPHKVMRATGFAGERSEAWERLGLLCCECNLCELYACPEDLTPREMCIQAKGTFAKKGVRPEYPPGAGKVHPMREHRRLPVDRLILRLGLTEYDRHAPLCDVHLEPSRVVILLKQHVGSPASPVVKTGDRVEVGQVLARVDENQLGTPIHSSIDGRVSLVDDKSVCVERA